MSLLKWGLFALVIGFVGKYAWRLWTDAGPEPVTFSWGPLAGAVVMSQVAWVPCVWYWRKLMSSLGHDAPLFEIVRAYYCGQLGKYVPGKATVILIRSLMLRECGVPIATTAFSVTLETLTYIAAGTTLTAMLIPWLFDESPVLARWSILADHPLGRIGVPLAVLAGALIALSLLSRGFVHLAARRASTIGAEGSEPRIDGRTTVAGLVVFLAGWWLQGAALGLTIQSVSPVPVDWSQLPFWTAIAALSIVVGFAAVFAPGGLGVREGLLMEALKPHLGPHHAVLAALLFRGVALAGEILISIPLYYLRSAHRPGGGNSV